LKSNKILIIQIKQVVLLHHNPDLSNLQNEKVYDPNDPKMANQLYKITAMKVQN